ncbi:MBOAT-domain-containing protein [Metschnikowia bicuspidata var. bicuspidata NRRL YB-4993]|uniref:O-acyltransferase n=1 Tax=Metschnikowia bicuspidata var. bicuspidata NRRL YB-4993 TaxID=869754 RepID=A0A1A0H7K7_9ASCO|nr:MBOAT-domain-containing protein [Metschnikowia bicuspidata var. bicuspidata NRRL YB-4993]OBA20079.1 MBOAT-domain-containing protein [Metschnikowia bicuspidata var. bicuspidata NRRL YB-4993]
MPSRNSLRSNLQRISKNKSREPLQCDFTPEISTPSESPPLGSKEAASRRGTKPIIQEKIKASDPRHFDQSTIENVFREIERNAHFRASRKKRNAGIFRSNFSDIETTPVPNTILEGPDFKSSQFFGFFILFWLGVGFLILKSLLHSCIDRKTALYKAPVFEIFTTGLFKIAFTDILMYLSIYAVYFIQVLCRLNTIQWRKTGRLITSIYELCFLVFWGYFICERLMKDQWIGRVFLVLHMFVLLMKMHSYAFYNGYLWKILREVQFSEDYYERLRNGSVELPEGFQLEATKSLIMESIAFCKFELLHQSVALEKANERGVLEKDSKELCSHLVKFPKNINAKDFFMYTMYPTVLYALVLPRKLEIRKKFLFEKLCALVGVILLMLIIADESIYPLVIRCNNFRATNASIQEKSFFALFALIDLIPPFTMEYMFVFYLIWDVILSAIAEVSKFADRDFYGPWWSCTDWLQFARYWNKPVHVFLHRHVYHSSISAFSLSKTTAGFITFLISSVVHEVVMYVIFGRVRGFLFLLQMAQIPLVLISQSRLLRDKKVLGNVVCWFGFVTGPPMICILYLIF